MKDLKEKKVKLEKKTTLRIWLFVLGIVVAILAACIIQIHYINLLHSN